MLDTAVLAVDVGSSAIRAAGIDAEARIVASSRVDRSDASTGGAFDAEMLWADFKRSIALLPRGVCATARAVCIAGHIGAVFVDRNLQVLGPGLGWADVQGVDTVVALLGSHLPEALRITGRPVPTGSAAAAYIALRGRDSKAASAVCAVLPPKDFLVARLTGILATDYTSAAYMGVCDVARRDWSSEILDKLELPVSILPRQLASPDVVETVARVPRMEMGLGAGCVVVCGGPDGSVGGSYLLGQRPGSIADVAGTTDVLVRAIDSLSEAPSGAAINPQPVGQGWTVGGPTGMTGGALTLWSRLFGFSSTQEALGLLEDRGAVIPPGADGLLICPSLSGARFPRWTPGTRGYVRGQGEFHRVDHFLRAVVEGAAFTVREGIDLLDPAGVAEIVLAGGATRSCLLSQMRADVLGRKVLVSSEADASLRGAGLIGLVGLGAAREAALAGAPMIEFIPNPAVAEAYRAVYANWRSLMPQMEHTRGLHD